jgi:hypothetical protein
MSLELRFSALSNLEVPVASVPRAAGTAPLYPPIVPLIAGTQV